MVTPLLCALMLALWWIGVRRDLRTGVFTTRLLYVSYFMAPFTIYPIFVAAFGSPLVGWRDPDSNKTAEIEQEATLLAAAFMALFLIGYAVASELRVARQAQLQPPRPRRMRAARRVMIMIGVLSTLPLAYFIYDIFGSVAEFLVLQGAYRGGEYQGTGYLTLPASFLFPLAMFMFLAARAAAGDHRVLVPILLLAGSTYANLLLGFRNIPAVFIFALVLFLSSMRALRMKQGMAAIAVMVMLFAAYNVAREWFDPGAEDSETAIARRILNPIIRTSATDIVTLVLEENDERPREYFTLLPQEWLGSLVPLNAFGIERISSSERFGEQVMLQVLSERSPFAQVTNTKGFSPTVVGLLTWQSGVFVALLLAPFLGWLCSAVDARIRGSGTWHKRALWSLLGATFVYSFESPVDAVSLLLKLVPVYWALLLSYLALGFGRNMQKGTAT